MLSSPVEGDKGNEGNDPPFEGCEGDQGNFSHPRIWRTWDTKEWRTNYPPPPNFDGHEEGDWEDHDYWRELSDDELAALAAAGISEQFEAPSELSIEQDEAERQAFFSGLAATAHHDQHPAPPLRSS